MSTSEIISCRCLLKQLSNNSRQEYAYFTKKNYIDWDMWIDWLDKAISLKLFPKWRTVHYVLIIRFMGSPLSPLHKSCDSWVHEMSNISNIFFIIWVFEVPFFFLEFQNEHITHIIYTTKWHRIVHAQIEMHLYSVKVSRHTVYLGFLCNWSSNKP